MMFAVSERDKFREVAVTIELDVYFNGAFGLAELGPGKDGKAEINNRGIKQVELAVELEPMLGGKLTATLQQLVKDSFIKSGRLFFINPG